MDDQYEKMNVGIEDLYLDPNNPRCVVTLNVEKSVPDSEIKSKQKELLSRFDDTGISEFFDVKDLIDSFKTVGYVPIDKIVIREVTPGKYVVLEGNRRVSALKILHSRHMKGEPGLEELVSEMQSLPALKLITKGLTDEELSHRVSVMLGIRHHGSLLEWGPLPKAYNIFSSYMSVSPMIGSFIEDRNRCRKVAARLSIKDSEVKKGLMSYIAFKQLKEELRGVKDHHFSLIQAAITNAKLKNDDVFLEIDKKSYLLADDSIDKMDQLCQFEVRDKPGFKKIIPEPKTFGIVGRLIEKTRASEERNVRDLAIRVLEKAMSGEIDPETGDLLVTFEGALNSVIDLETRTKWKQELNKLLTKQKDELSMGSFHNEGNDLMALRELKDGLIKLQRMLGVEG